MLKKTIALTTLLTSSTLLLSAAASDQKDTADVQQASTFQSGMRTYIDPQTGKATAPSAQQLEALPLSIEEEEMMSTSSSGLYEEQAPGGGVMVNLQGRFASAVFVRVDDAGKITIDHNREIASPENKATDINQPQLGGK